MSIYSRNAPFFATIKERYRLNHVGSSKETYHLTLDISGSGLRYSVGDSVAILPQHDDMLVSKTIHAMSASSEAKVIDKRSGCFFVLREYLTSKVNITKIHKPLLVFLAERQQESSKKKFLLSLFSEENKGELAEYLSSYELWDLLEDHKEAIYTPQELINELPPLLPRFYSIASSCQYVGEEIHLTVAVTRFVSRGRERMGVGTHFLCQLAPLHQRVVPLYLQPSHGFTLPQDKETPIIMVGPGTGVAPFRAFMQEKLAQNASGKSWLFFGERQGDFDYFYKDFWSELTVQGKLRLVCAFSRDQSEKVYVQDRLREHGHEVWQWLQEGAHFYVCGDAERMAKGVERTLHEIAIHHGKMEEPQAKDYLKKLRASKRYLKDVY